MPLPGWLLPYGKPQRVAAWWVGFLQSVFRNYRVVILLLQLHEFLAHRFDDGLHSGQVDIVVEVDEFITAVAHAVVAFHSVLGGIFVVVIVESVAPLHILVAAKQWQA